MLALDTNVVFELRKAKAGKAYKQVSAWAAGVPAATMYVSVITILELETGVLLVQRRDAAQGALLWSWLDQHVLPAFAERVLPVDTAVARRYVALHVPARCAEREALIAATALVHGRTVVTRKVADFAGTHVALINPWETPL